MRVGFDTGALDQNKGVNPLLVPLEFTNAICYGQTGTGKTSSFILPNIEERMLQGHSVIVFDFKGNLHLKVKAIAQSHQRLNDVIELGTLWGERLNLLEGLSENEIDTLLSPGGFSKDYWDIASLSLFKALYFSRLELKELYRFLQEKNLEADSLRSFNTPPTFQAIYELLKPSEIGKHISVLGAAIGVIHKTLVENDSLMDHIKMHHALSHFEKKLKQFALELNAFKHVKEEERDSGNHAVMNCLKNMIQDLARISFLNEPCAQPIGEVIHNKIVIINSENIGKSATHIINARLFSALKKRAGKPYAKGVSLFLDEAHKIITPKTLPEVSVCRECRFEYIMATQDERLLKRSVGVLETEEMLVNVAFVLSYKNINDERCEDLEPFYYYKGNTKAKAKPLFFSPNQEQTAELLFQEQRNIVEAHTDRKSTGGYLENDTDLFARECAYYVDPYGFKTMVRIFPRMDVDTIVYDTPFVEKNDSPISESATQMLKKRVEGVESVVSTLIAQSHKARTPSIEANTPKSAEQKCTVKMILKDENRHILAVRYFKAKKDVAAFLCKLRPRTHEEFLFFKELLKIASKKEHLLEIQPAESFLELPYDRLLYVSLPKKTVTAKEDEHDEKSA